MFLQLVFIQDHDLHSIKFLDKICVSSTCTCDFNVILNKLKVQFIAQKGGKIRFKKINEMDVFVLKEKHTQNVLKLFDITT